MHLLTQYPFLINFIFRRYLQVTLKIINVYICIVDVCNFINEFLKIVGVSRVRQVSIKCGSITQLLSKFVYHNAGSAAQLIYIVSIIPVNEKRNSSGTNNDK